MRKLVNDTDAVYVAGWMVKDLGLSGNSLMIYAIIYGYSQDGSGDYHGGYRYLAEFAGCSMSSAIGITKKLVEAGLLTKEEEPVGGNIIPHFKAVRRGING